MLARAGFVCCWRGSKSDMMKREAYLKIDGSSIGSTHSIKGSSARIMIGLYNMERIRFHKVHHLPLAR